jgi:hypothetical protein
MIFRRFYGVGSFGFLAALAALAGCGIRTPLDLDDAVTGITEKDAGHAGTVPIADAGPALDASVPVDASSGIDDGGATADVALPAVDLGDIILTSGAYTGGKSGTLNASAVFYPSVTATGCSVALVAGCKLETCASPAGGAPLANAGTISITGGAYPLVLTPGSGDLYSTPPSNEDSGVLALWYGGEQLQVSASGADVPAFAASLVAPSQITVVTQMPTSITRSEPFDVSWFKKSVGQVAVDVSSTAGPTSYYLECLFDVAAGLGEVPQAALAQIAGGTGTLSVFTVSKVTVTAGGWTVGTYAETDANDPNGVEWTGAVGIQ